MGPASRSMWQRGEGPLPAAPTAFGAGERSLHLECPLPPLFAAAESAMHPTMSQGTSAPPPVPTPNHQQRGSPHIVIKARLSSGERGAGHRTPLVPGRCDGLSRVCVGVTAPLGTSNADRSLGSTGEHHPLPWTCWVDPFTGTGRQAAMSWGHPALCPRRTTPGLYSPAPAMPQQMLAAGLPSPPTMGPFSMGTPQAGSQNGQTALHGAPNSPAMLEPRAHSRPPSDSDPGVCAPEPKNAPSLRMWGRVLGGLTDLLWVLLGLRCSCHPLPLF